MSDQPNGGCGTSEHALQTTGAGKEARRHVSMVARAISPDSLPACAKPCIVSAEEDSGCRIADSACLCTNKGFRSSSTARCVQKACSVDEVVETFELIDAVCAEATQPPDAHSSAAATESSSNSSPGTSSSPTAIPTSPTATSTSDTLPATSTTLDSATSTPSLIALPTISQYQPGTIELPISTTTPPTAPSPSSSSRSPSSGPGAPSTRTPTSSSSPTSLTDSESPAINYTLSPVPSSTSSTAASDGNNALPSSEASRHRPASVATVLAVALGLVVLAALVGGCVWWNRRGRRWGRALQRLKTGEDKGGGVDDGGARERIGSAVEESVAEPVPRSGESNGISVGGADDSALPEPGVRDWTAASAGETACFTPVSGTFVTSHPWSSGLRESMAESKCGEDFGLGAEGQGPEDRGSIGGSTAPSNVEVLRSIRATGPSNRWANGHEEEPPPAYELRDSFRYRG